jgi:phosphatidate cytidylyltransferase
MTSAQESQRPRLTFNLDWITRPVFAVLLGGAALASTVGGGAWFALFVSLIVIAAAREYHRMVSRHSYLTAFAVTVAATAAMLFVPVLFGNYELPWLILFGAVVVNLVLALAMDERPVWQGAGAIYLCIPALSATLIREAPEGIWIIVGLFVAVWATDTGALVAGNLIGGRKLAPVISPNKTWSGTLGGIAAAAIVELAFMAFIGGNLALGAFYGAAVAVVAHSGDLLESWMKRKFQRKDSGSLIPGHGGMLDRIDSTLSAVTAVAALVFLLHVDPLFGARP